MDTQQDKGLGPVIEKLAHESPRALKAAIMHLAEAISGRTGLIPEDVTLEGVSQALQQLLGQMIDRVVFYRRHEVALRYFKVQLSK